MKTSAPRKQLCPKHENRLRELLVLCVRDAETFKKLGIEAKPLATGAFMLPSVEEEGK